MNFARPNHGMFWSCPNKTAGDRLEEFKQTAQKVEEHIRGKKQEVDSGRQAPKVKTKKPTKAAKIKQPRKEVKVGEEDMGGLHREVEKKGWRAINAKDIVNVCAAQPLDCRKELVWKDKRALV